MSTELLSQLNALIAGAEASAVEAWRGYRRFIPAAQILWPDEFYIAS